MSYFRWKCPKCAHITQDDIDAETGPFITVICGKCNAGFDDTALSPDEVRAWDEAIEEATKA
jgi:hypothetical protein